MSARKDAMGESGFGLIPFQELRAALKVESGENR
jgi:hypothetical protein